MEVLLLSLSSTLTQNPIFPVVDVSFLVGELDGVRIINSTNQELLQEVPLVCQDIFKIASMAPGALLLEAHREYEVPLSAPVLQVCSQLDADSSFTEIQPES